MGGSRLATSTLSLPNRHIKSKTHTRATSQDSRMFTIPSAPRTFPHRQPLLWEQAPRIDRSMSNGCYTNIMISDVVPIYQGRSNNRQHHAAHLYVFPAPCDRPSISRDQQGGSLLGLARAARFSLFPLAPNSLLKVFSSLEILTPSLKRMLARLTLFFRCLATVSPLVWHPLTS